MDDFGPPQIPQQPMQPQVPQQPVAPAVPFSPPAPGAVPSRIGWCDECSPPCLLVASIARLLFVMTSWIVRQLFPRCRTSLSAKRRPTIGS